MAMSKRLMPRVRATLTRSHWLNSLVPRLAEASEDVIIAHQHEGKRGEYASRRGASRRAIGGERFRAYNGPPYGRCR